MHVTSWTGAKITSLTNLLAQLRRGYRSATECSAHAQVMKYARTYIMPLICAALLSAPHRKAGHFTTISDNLIELNSNAFMTQKLAAGWLAQRLDLMGLFVLTGTGRYCCVLGGRGVPLECVSTGPHVPDQAT